MKKYRLLFLSILCLSISISTFGQLSGPAVGTWKRTAMTSVNADGSIITNVPAECGAMKKTIESMNGDGKCTMTGNKLTVTSSKLPPAVYDVQFKGNTMIWFFDYTANPQTLNPGGKTKSVTLTYTRI
jgi:hypothetical protein